MASIIQKYLYYYLESVNNNNKDFKIMHKLEDKYLKDNIEYGNRPYDFQKSLYYNEIYANKYSYHKLEYIKNNMIRYIKKIKTLDYYKNNIIVIYFPGIYHNYESTEIFRNLIKTIKIPYNIKYILIVYFKIINNYTIFNLYKEKINLLNISY
jgi:hypothetical protein